MSTQVQNFIDGRRQPASTSNTLPLYEPATGARYGTVPASDASDVNAAVAAAKQAAPGWAATPPAVRAQFLRKIADGIDKHHERLAQAESADTGKPIALARSVDIPRSAQNFRFFADAITQYGGECAHTQVAPSASTAGGGSGSQAAPQAATQAINYTLHQPLGVVACIAPWNLPLYLLTWKLAPALATGNTVVAKPSELTPVTADLLTEMVTSAGLPPGVLNVIHGTGADAGAALVAHSDVAAISFTGSTATGASIAKVAAAQFKKLALEMGGKNASIVFADCDIDTTVQQVTRAAFANQGQICLCGSRIFVQRTIYDTFKGKLLQSIEQLRCGDPAEPQTQQGAVVSSAHRDKILGYLQIAQSEGGTILCGGADPVDFPPDHRCADGWFVRPTLIEGLAADCQVNQEEIFGPVATLIPFDHESEAIAWANSTRYGLAASVWTQNISRGHRVAAAIDSGIVWVNCWMLRDLRTPFGGMKDSGVGREGGTYALRFFTEPKNVCVAYG